MKNQLMKKILALFATGALTIGSIALFGHYAENMVDYYTFLMEEPEVLTPPLGLPPVPWPEDNPYSQKKAELGRLLYFDKRLSSDGTVSCATCHTIPRAFSDPNNISIGIHNRKGTRHAPSVINTAYQSALFWDGRASSLEEQCKGPISNPNEMTSEINPVDAHLQCEKNIRSIGEYRTLFKEVFGNEDCSLDQIAKSIATFERTILSGNSPYDRYKAGDKSALTEDQFKGYVVFLKAGCRHCHAGPNLTDGRYMNIGIGMDQEKPDLGRYDITHQEEDRGAFKVPTLREVAHTYPYMHDGSLATLKDVIDYYDRGGNPNSNLHPLMVPLNLSEDDKKALHQFLFALSGEGWHQFTEPKEFPQ
jgi:cytochrome c peroxidase